MTREAYGEAYERNFNLTVRFLLSKGIPDDSAREAAQAAWVRGWEKQKQLRNPKMLGPWINTIAWNIFRNSLRKQRLHDELPPDLGKAPEPVAALVDISRSLRRCNASEQQLLRQRYAEGYTSTELAKGNRY